MGASLGGNRRAATRWGPQKILRAHRLFQAGVLTKTREETKREGEGISVGQTTKHAVIYCPGGEGRQFRGFRYEKAIPNRRTYLPFLSSLTSWSPRSPCTARGEPESLAVRRIERSPASGGTIQRVGRSHGMLAATLHG